MDPPVTVDSFDPRRNLPDIETAATTGGLNPRARSDTSCPLPSHPYVIACYGINQVHRSELARLKARIVENARPAATITDPISLHRIARAIGGGLKPWGRILGGLLNGDMDFAASAGTTKEIFVSASDASKLLEIEPDDTPPDGQADLISQRDAAEILNLPLKHAALLPSVEASEGTRRISLSQVLALARDRVTLAELSARTGIHGTRLQSLLDREGCSKSDELGWTRSQVLSALASSRVERQMSKMSKHRPAPTQRRSSSSWPASVSG